MAAPFLKQSTEVRSHSDGVCVSVFVMCRVNAASFHHIKLNPNALYCVLTGPKRLRRRHALISTVMLFHVSRGCRAHVSSAAKCRPVISIVKLFRSSPSATFKSSIKPHYRPRIEIRQLTSNHLMNERSHSSSFITDHKIQSKIYDYMHALHSHERVIICFLCLFFLTANHKHYQQVVNRTAVCGTNSD